jgi:hypothetical protein
MLIDGNKMIEILGLPEWDDRVLDILEEFGEERPELEDEDDIYPLFKYIEKINVQFMFNDIGDNIKQRNDSEGNIYLNQILFDENTKVDLPFNLEIGDSKETIEKKIGEKAYSKNNRKENKLNWLLDDGEKKYFIHCTFEDNEHTNLVGIWLSLFDEEINYNVTIL